ncbi:sterol 3beta-glucosyltransferase [Promicromonospora umidemergens]|uniref:Glycosyltransferase n=1 Tax=Promicromonospora umidemergens TaxID=629679 RepID=A0ABP8XNZ2_9MICO|nr:glycosyltransferase [Promicromonospora umidemergens]MCP2282020.1 sterol 3beta-glucosyltransferase [Promicromonospora umidemergens]
MKALIMTLGTRGDVQPFVALARALDAAGHEAVLCAPHRFAELVTGNGVTFAGVDDGPLRQLDTPAAAGEAFGGGVRARLRQVREMPSMFDQVLADSWQVAAHGAGAGADVVVHNGQIVAGQHVAEALGTPAVLGLPLPMYVPTREFPWPGQSLPFRLPGRLNRVTFAGMRLPASMFGRVVDRWRRDTLGLPSRPGRHDPTVRPDGGPAPVLHAYSPAVLPQPKDWPAGAEVTGYWFLPPEPELSDDVERFLADGPAPLFAGFGSMSGQAPQTSTRAVVEAAALTRHRLVLATAWGGLDAETARATAAEHGVELLVVGDVDYQRLFPRMAAIVHHGGAGTTGTAFAAGRPQVVCPFVADQPFWGHVAHARGVAPEPLAQRRLTGPVLAARIAEACAPAAVAAASELRDRVARERGLERAVALIERAAEVRR